MASLDTSFLDADMLDRLEDQQVVGRPLTSLNDLDLDKLMGAAYKWLDDTNGEIADLGLSYQVLSQKGAANGYASLNAFGKIPDAQIPSIAINDVYPVADQAAMLALAATQGDVAIQTIPGTAFILATNSPSTLADWKQLSTAPVPADFNDGGDIAGAGRILGNTDAFDLTIIANGAARITAKSAGGALITGDLDLTAGSLYKINGTQISSANLSDAASLTAQGNTFNGASQLVQLSVASALPAVSGAALTALNASNIASGTLSDARLSANATVQGNTFNGASQLAKTNADSQLIPAAGTAALPAYSFSADLDTGVYRSAADTLAFATGGVLRLSIGTGLTGSSFITAAGGSTGGGLRLSTGQNIYYESGYGRWIFEAGFNGNRLSCDGGVNGWGVNLGTGANDYPKTTLDINGSQMRLIGTFTPASAAAAGEVGTFAWDSSFFYVCTAANTWKRTALSTW